MQIHLADLRAAIAATDGEQIALAFALTSISFLALTGYDALALRQLKLHVPYPTTALASFTSYAVSFHPRISDHHRRHGALLDLFGEGALRRKGSRASRSSPG